MKILFVASEMVPFAKTGGLGDVAGALPDALQALGLDIRMVMPLYRSILKSRRKIRFLPLESDVPLGDVSLHIRVGYSKTKAGVPVYFVHREDLFDRPHLYGDASGDYYDNLERFTVLAQSALTLLEGIDFKPDLIHCHDWQTGLIPALLSGPFKNKPFAKGTKTLFTIHNIGYQGIFPVEKLPLTGLSPNEYFHPEGLEFWGKISLLKAGITYSDAVTTVSPKYAEEIQTSAYGMGMEGILKKRRDVLYGILNGIDNGIWNPVTDKYLESTYSVKNLKGKAACKKALIQEMNLDPLIEKKPLIAMITRLDVQKGLDLLLQILDDIIDLDAGFVMLGAGDEKIQDALSGWASRHTERAAVKIGFDNALAHRIMAGADIFLVPSKYEPCGLTQMYALKYGTVPIVRATGGLDDTVKEYDPFSGKGTGFKFSPFEAEAFFFGRQKRRRIVQKHILMAPTHDKWHETGFFLESLSKKLF